MDDNAAKENPSPDFNKLDLTQLQSFSFGTQWTKDKEAPATDDRRDRGDRPPRRDDRRSAPDRRDRRTFQKPAGAPAGNEDGAGAPAHTPERRQFSGDRRQRRDQATDAPARAGDHAGGQRFAPRGEPQRMPYDSPHFGVTFYPEDTSFNALAKTIRASCRTIELFEIARTVIAKEDRFVAVLARKPSADGTASKAPLYISVPDGVPFESQEAVVAHVFSRHLGLFFDTSEVEIEAPKGNYQVINKCGVTGELLGPPNYHLYNQYVQQYHAAQIKGLSLEAYRARIETVRDPEVVAQWLAKMKKVTRYTWKNAPAVVPAEMPKPTEPAPAEVATTEAAPAQATDAPVETPSETPVEVAAVPVADAPPAPHFDSIDEARAHLLSQASERVFKTVETARFHGRIYDSIPPGEIRRAIEGSLERQRRFPLDTANALRGRLRREHFTIFKKGSKGVSYVCAVKRKFRTPGQVFADSIGALISFIEARPMIRASELPAKFLGMAQIKPAEGETAPELTPEMREKFIRMQGDLRWLVTEGYVTELIDGRLFAPPPMAEAKKKEAENEENDPENFPESPAAEEPAPVTGSANAPAADHSPAVENPPVEEKKPAPTATATPAAEPETPPHTD